MDTGNPVLLKPPPPGAGLGLNFPRQLTTADNNSCHIEVSYVLTPCDLDSSSTRTAACLRESIRTEGRVWVPLQGKQALLYLKRRVCCPWASRAPGLLCMLAAQTPLPLARRVSAACGVSSDPRRQLGSVQTCKETRIREREITSSPLSSKTGRQRTDFRVHLGNKPGRQSLNLSTRVYVNHISGR